MNVGAIPGSQVSLVSDSVLKIRRDTVLMPLISSPLYLLILMFKTRLLL